ncbi:MAG: DUF3619 family protein, partial [Burkholderiales bacterium]
MNEQDLGRKIARYLEQGANRLRQGTLYRLQAARSAALQKYHAEPAFGLAGEGLAPSRLRHSQLLSLRFLLPLALVLLSLGGIVYWQTAQQSNDVDEIDAHLLTDDLPINAYLDKDFDAWLK